jgi:UDPglucose 6-dehydrogenase/GDP-mannose 6-dehydrogenase
MRVSIVGAGYVGLVTAACLADKGHDVVCVDVAVDKVQKINDAVPPFVEPGLAELLRKHAGVRLQATTDLRRAVLGTDVTFIAVGTPYDGRTIDLTHLKSAATGIGDALRDKPTYHLVVVKSTVVPGTTDDVVRPLLEAMSGRRVGLDFGVGMNPEFLTEGEAINDFMLPDRLVLGGVDARSQDVLAEIYAGFPDVARIRTNNKTAEMIKYASNAVLATLISFSNELANLCAALRGVDIAEVMEGVHASRYLTSVTDGASTVTAPIASFLWAGCGFGGSCLPKDLKALIAHGDRAGVDMRLLDAVMQVNDDQPLQILALLERHFPSLHGIRVTVLGLAFRPGTDDIRESPAVPIIRQLLARGAAVRVYDPVARPSLDALFGEPAPGSAASLAEAIDGAQAIVLVTRWAEFADLPRRLEGIEPAPVVVDGRRMLPKRAIARYEGIGL